MWSSLSCRSNREVLVRGGGGGGEGGERLEGCQEERVEEMLERKGGRVGGDVAASLPF